MTEQPLEPARSSPDLSSITPPGPLEAIDGPSAAEAAAAGDGSGAAAKAASSPGESVATNAARDPGDASLLPLIDRLAGLLERTELTELEVQVGSTGLVLRKPSAIAPPVPALAAGAAPVDASAAAAPGAEAGAPSRPSVKAPLSGIWYGSPAPGSAPYVGLGGEVAVGQVIGLIEAMKLFNEIKSDLAGRVVKINAENGKLVRAKQPLIEVEPL